MGLFDFFKKQPNEADWMSMLPKEFADALLMEIKNNPQACNLDEIPQGVGRFGLVPTNPVPVYGIPSSQIYLHKLRDRAGERLRWRRNGSFDVNNIAKKVDEYEIYDFSGDVLTTIYISPYHWKTSSKAPAGFKYVG